MPLLFIFSNKNIRAADFHFSIYAIFVSFSNFIGIILEYHLK